MNTYNNPPLSPEFDDNGKVLFAIFIKNRDMLNAYIENIEFSTNAIDPVAFLMCRRCLACSDSMLRILTYGSIEDATMLFRSFLETTVNVGFINCSDNNAVEMMYEYTTQMIAREMDSMYQFAGTKFEYQKIPKELLTRQAQELIQKYTTKKGKLIRDWTKKRFSNEKKVECILKEFKGVFAQVIPMVFISHYGDASELLHGSLHGINKFLIGSNDPTNHSDLNSLALKNRKPILLQLLQSLNITLMALFEFMAKDNYSNLDTYQKASDSLRSILKDIFKE